MRTILVVLAALVLAPVGFAAKESVPTGTITLVSQTATTYPALNDGTATFAVTATSAASLYVHTTCILGPQHSLVYDKTIVLPSNEDEFTGQITVSDIPYWYGGSFNQYAATCVASLVFDNHTHDITLDQASFVSYLA